MPGVEPLDRVAAFGKYRGAGLTWGQVAEKDPDYARWAIENADGLDEEVREALQMALEDADWDF